VSFALDVNLLLFASDRSSPFHSGAGAFLQRCVTQTELYYLAWPTLMSYLRMATHPRIFTHPLSPTEALNNIRMLVSVPHVRTLSEEEGYLEIYQELTGDLSVRGNLVPDAHLAVLLFQHEIKILYTTDADFRKFSWLTVKNPLN
jgi:uncharacterized protein